MTFTLTLQCRGELPPDVSVIAQVVPAGDHSRLGSRFEDFSEPNSTVIKREGLDTFETLTLILPGSTKAFDIFFYDVSGSEGKISLCLAHASRIISVTRKLNSEEIRIEGVFSRQPSFFCLSDLREACTGYLKEYNFRCEAIQHSIENE